jgi:transmembrane 9 superfamily protein 3
MRTLRKDYAKYARESGDLDDLDQELDESGWKQVHGDVFRPPAQLALFCALIGTGSQLAAMVGIMIIFATATTLYMGRGGIIISFLLVYCLSSIVAGYTSGSLYSRSGGQSWIRTMIYTASLFPAFCFATALLLNFVGLLYGSLATVPFISVLSVLLMWALVALPLTVIGTILGRNWSGTPNNPCRINAIPRLIPDKRWFARPPILIALGGVLPFGSIFIEMYFVFTSFWNYKFYYVYGFMLLVFLILTVVTICVTIVVTYFLLNNEDYRWMWTSFAASSSTAGYVLLYSIYYFFMKTKMSGFFQTLFYFSYMLVFCLALGIMCGAIGFLGSSVFVRRIYRNIKCD